MGNNNDQYLSSIRERVGEEKATSDEHLFVKIGVRKYKKAIARTA